MAMDEVSKLYVEGNSWKVDCELSAWFGGIVLSLPNDVGGS